MTSDIGATVTNQAIISEHLWSTLSIIMGKKDQKQPQDFGFVETRPSTHYHTDPWEGWQSDDYVIT